MENNNKKTVFFLNFSQNNINLLLFIGHVIFVIVSIDNVNMTKYLREIWSYWLLCCGRCVVRRCAFVLFPKPFHLSDGPTHYTSSALNMFTTLSDADGMGWIGQPEKCHLILMRRIADRSHCSDSICLRTIFRMTSYYVTSKLHINDMMQFP